MRVEYFLACRCRTPRELYHLIENSLALFSVLSRHLVFRKSRKCPSAKKSDEEDRSLTQLRWKGSAVFSPEFFRQYNNKHKCFLYIPVIFHVV